MIRFACSNCGRHISVDDKHSGKKGKCPQCGNVVVVPGKPAVIEFHCESCGQKIKVSQAHAGRKGKCPRCKDPVVVPALKKAPAEKAKATTATCSMCGQLIEIPEGSSEEFAECPTCGSYVEASSEGIRATRAESSAPAPPTTDEEFHEGPAEAPQKTVGVDRRLIVVIAGAAAIVVVGVVALVLLLRSGGSRPVEQPERLSGQREAADTPSAPEPVASDTEPRQLSRLTFSPNATEAIGLGFRPPAGYAQTVEVTTRQRVTSMESGGRIAVTRRWQYFVVDLEVMDTQIDGTVSIRGTFVPIRATSGMSDSRLAKYNATKPQRHGDPVGCIYGPFIGKSCTVHVSPRGEIVGEELDELFLAVAEHRAKCEDDMTRERLGARAAGAMGYADKRSASSEARLLRLKKQFEDSPLFGAEEIRSLLRNLFFSPPEESVRSGDRWSCPLAVHVGTPLEIAAEHMLTAVENGTCTIKAEGQRSPDEEPYVYVRETGGIKITNRLGGSSEATLKVDRATGWLLSKEQKTSLSGQITTTTTGPPPRDSTARASTEITTTVNTVK